MPTVLLVGEVSEATVATLENHGFSIDAMDRERLLDTGEATDDGPAVAADGVGAVDCAIVSAGADDERVIEALGNCDAEFPVLYAVPESDAATAGAALQAGADDRVLLTDDRDDQRILGRLAAFEAVDGTSNGLGPTANGAGGPLDTTERNRGAFERNDGTSGRNDGTPERDDGRSERIDGTSDRYDGTHDDQIGALLECGQAFMDADTAEAVADTAVETAERALGYDLVAVRLLGDDGETFRLVVRSERTEELLDDLDEKPVSESVVAEAIEEGEPIELDRETLESVGADPVASSLVFPLGEHGIIGIGSTTEDAFGQKDRRMGELLASNARGALDRIDRVERIEAIHRSMREMLDTSSPEAVADVAVTAAREILGYPFVACFLEGDVAGELEPVAWTDETEAVTGGELPAPSEGDGALEAFRTGAVVSRDEDDSTTSEGWSFASRLHVPIDGHGSLLVATPGTAAFDETDVQLARLLATNTSRALDRVERTQELERLETVFETVNDMVYVNDEDGKILHCTPALADRLGYDTEEMVGAEISDFIDQETEDEAIEIIKELVGEPPGTTRTHRLDLSTVDGEEVPVEIDYSLLPSEQFRGVVGAVRDISDLVAVRERLDTQQDRFEYLFENIPDPVVEGYFDDEAVVESANAAFLETFGLSEEEIAGESLNDVIVPDDDLDRARALDEQTAAGKVNHAEVQRETQYGLREFLFRGVPYETPDGTTRGFGIYTDITDQKERERHLEVLQRLLRHNVRNEVNVLLAGIDQLEEVRDGGEGREAELLTTLEETAQDLLSMGQKAKRISRVIDAEDEELGEVDAASIVRSVVDRFRELGSDATIEVDAPEHCPVVGTSAIERAVEELVGNALEHAGPSPRISVTLTCDVDGAELTVVDDGPGIPDAEREVLEEGEITPLKHGSGLGLWLVTHAAAASGGTVSFDEDADGASVTLSFRTIDGA